MHNLVPVTYRRLSHHEAVFRDIRDRALGDKMRHPFRTLRNRVRQTR